jgi:hypothetical protein
VAFPATRTSSSRSTPHSPHVRLAQSQGQSADFQLEMNLRNSGPKVGLMRLMFLSTHGSCVSDRTQFQTNAQEPNDAREQRRTNERGD